MALGSLPYYLGSAAHLYQQVAAPPAIAVEAPCPCETTAFDMVRQIFGFVGNLIDYSANGLRYADGLVTVVAKALHSAISGKGRSGSRGRPGRGSAPAALS